MPTYFLQKTVNSFPKIILIFCQLFKSLSWEILDFQKLFSDK